MTARRRRGARREPRGRLRLRQRDREVLAWIGRAGVVELPEVARLFWGDTGGARSAAARRLRKLGDHGLVEASTVSLDRPNRVALTERGADWLPVAADESRVLRLRVRAQGTAADHLIASARVWAALALRVRGSEARLVRYVTEGEFRRLLGRRSGALVPDGFALLGARSGGQVTGLALEVDLGTEPASVFVRKARRYAAHFETGQLYGLPLHALVVYAPGRARLQGLARAAERGGVARWTVLGDLDGVAVTTVVDALGAAPAVARGGAGSAFCLSLLSSPYEVFP